MIEKRVLWGEQVLRAYYTGPFATTTEADLLRFIADDLDAEGVETIVSVVFDLDSETDDHRAKVTYTVRASGVAQAWRAEQTARS